MEVETHMKKVAVVMGSDSDLKTMQAAIDMLRNMEVPFSVRILSAHRTPEAARDFAANAAKNNYGVIICAAGKATVCPSRKKLTGLPNCWAKYRSVFMDGWALPFSICESIFLVIYAPQSCLWERPASIRAALILPPSSIGITPQVSSIYLIIPCLSADFYC